MPKESEGEPMPETPREAMNWFVSDAEQAAEERKLMRESQRRVTERRDRGPYG